MVALPAPWRNIVDLFLFAADQFHREPFLPSISTPFKRDFAAAFHIGQLSFTRDDYHNFLIGCAHGQFVLLYKLQRGHNLGIARLVVHNDLWIVVHGIPRISFPKVPPVQGDIDQASKLAYDFPVRIYGFIPFGPGSCSGQEFRVGILCLT